MEGKDNMLKNQKYYQKLGWALRVQRKRKNVTIQEMAEKLQISGQQLSKYELGENRIPIDKLDEYCEILNIKAKWLIDFARKVKEIG